MQFQTNGLIPFDDDWNKLPPGETEQSWAKLSVQDRLAVWEGYRQAREQAPQARQEETLLRNVSSSISGTKVDWSEFNGIGSTTRDALYQKGIFNLEHLYQAVSRYEGDASAFGNAYGVQGWRVQQYILDPHQKDLRDRGIDVSALSPAWNNTYLPSPEFMRNLPEGMPIPRTPEERNQMNWVMNQPVQANNGVQRKDRGFNWINPAEATIQQFNMGTGQIDNVPVTELVKGSIDQYNRRQEEIFNALPKAKRDELEAPQRASWEIARDAEDRPVLRTNYWDYNGSVESYDIHAAALPSQSNQPQFFINNREGGSGGYALMTSLQLGEESVDRYGKLRTTTNAQGQQTVEGIRMQMPGNILSDALTNTIGRNLHTSEGRTDVEKEKPDVTETLMRNRAPWFNYSGMSGGMLAWEQGSVVPPKEKVYQDVEGKRQRREIQKSDADLLLSTARVLTGNQTYGYSYSQGHQGSFFDLGNYTKQAIAKTTNRVVYDANGNPRMINDPNAEAEAYWIAGLKRTRLNVATRGARDLQVSPGVNAPTTEWHGVVEGMEDFRMSGGKVLRRYSYDQINPEGQDRVRKGAFLSSFTNSGFLPGTTLASLQENYGLAQGNVYTHNDYRYRDLPARTEGDRFNPDWQGISAIPGLPNVKVGNRLATRMKSMREVDGGVEWVSEDLTPWEETEDKGPHKYVRAASVGYDPRMALLDAQGNATGQVDVEGAIPGDKDFARVAVNAFMSLPAAEIRNRAISAMTTVGESYTDPTTGETSKGRLFVNPETNRPYTRAEASASINILDTMTGEYLSPQEMRDPGVNALMAEGDTRYAPRLNPIIAEEAAMRWWYGGIQEQQVTGDVISDVKYQQYRELEEERKAAFVQQLQERHNFSPERAATFAEGAGRSKWQFFTSAEKQVWKDAQGNARTFQGDELYNWKVSYNQRFRDVETPDYGTLELRTSGRARLTMELLDNMAETQPGLFQGIAERAMTHEFDNPAFNAFMAYRMNVRDEEGNLSPAAQRLRDRMENPVNLSGEEGSAFFADLQQAREKAVQTLGPMKDDRIAREAINIVGHSDQWRGRNLMIGDTVLPSADTIGNYTALSREGDMIPNFGSKLLGVLGMEEAYQTQKTNLGTSPETEEDFRSTRKAAMGAALQELGDLFQHPGVRESSMEIEAPALSGAARSGALPNNIAVTSTRDFAQLVKRLDDNVAMDTLRKYYGEDYQLGEGMTPKGALIRGFHKGDFVADMGMVMYPQANQSKGIQGIGLISEKTAAPYLGSLRPNRQGAMTNEGNVMVFGKDQDGDTYAMVINAGTGETVKTLKGDELKAAMVSSPAGEYEGAKEKARRAFDMPGTGPRELLDIQRRQKMVKPNDFLVDSSEQSAMGKFAMAYEYNPSIRNQSFAARMMMDAAGLSDDKRKALYGAQSQTGQSVYQLAADQEPSLDPAATNVREMINHATIYGNPNEPKDIAAGLTGGKWSENDKHFTTFSEAFGGTQPLSQEAFGSAMADQLLQYGMRHRGVGDEKAIEAGKEIYRRDVGDYARMMLPQGVSDEEVATLAGRLQNYSENRYGESLSEDEFKQWFGVSKSQWAFGRTRDANGEIRDMTDQEAAVLPMYVMGNVLANAGERIDTHIKEGKGAWGHYAQGESIDVKGPLSLVLGRAKGWGETFRKTIDQTAGIRNQYDQAEGTVARAAGVAEVAGNAARGHGLMVERAGGRGFEGDDASPTTHMARATAVHLTPTGAGVAPALTGSPDQVAPLPEMEPSFDTYNTPEEPEEFRRHFSNTVTSAEAGDPLETISRSVSMSAAGAPPSGGRPPAPPAAPPADSGGPQDWRGRQAGSAIVQFAPGGPRSEAAMARALESYKRLSSWTNEMERSGTRPEPQDVEKWRYNDYNAMHNVFEAMYRRHKTMLDQGPDYEGPGKITHTPADTYFANNFLAEGVDVRALESRMADAGLIDLAARSYDMQQIMGKEGGPLGDKDRAVLGQSLAELSQISPESLGMVASGIQSPVGYDDQEGRHLIGRRVGRQAQQLLAARRIAQGYQARLATTADLGIHAEEDIPYAQALQALNPMLEDQQWGQLEAFETALTKTKTVALEDRERDFAVRPFKESLAMEMSARTVMDADRISRRTGIKNQQGETVENLEQLVDSLKNLSSVSKDNFQSVQHLSKAMDDLDTRYAHAASRQQKGEELTPQQKQAMSDVEGMAFGGKTGREALNAMQEGMAGFAQRVGLGDVEVTAEQQRESVWNVLTKRGDRARRLRDEYQEEGLLDDFLGSKVNRVLGRVFGGNQEQVASINQQAALTAGSLASGLSNMVSPHGLWQMRTAYSMFIQPTMRAAEGFEASELQRSAALAGAGRADLGDMLSGTGGELMRRRAQSEITGRMYQEAAYDVMAPILGMGNTGIGRGVTQASAIAMPALGAGLISRQLFGGSWQAGVAGAAIAGTAALYSSAWTARNDPLKMSGEKGGWQMFLANAGSSMDTIWDDLTGWSKEDRENYARQWSSSEFTEAAKGIAAGGSIDAIDRKINIHTRKKNDIFAAAAMALGGPVGYAVDRRIRGDQTKSGNLLDIYGQGEILQAGYGMWIQQQQEAGLSEDMATQTMQTWAQYHPITSTFRQALPTAQASKDIASLAMQNVDVKSLVQAQMASRGLQAIDFDAVRQLYDQNVSRLAQSDTAQSQSMMEAWGAQQVTGINALRRTLGQQELGGDWALQFYQNGKVNVPALETSQMLETTALQNQLNSGIAIPGSMRNNVQDLINSGQYGAAQRLISKPVPYTAGAMMAFRSGNVSPVYGRELMGQLTADLSNNVDYNALGQDFTNYVQNFVAGTGTQGFNYLYNAPGAAQNRNTFEGLAAQAFAQGIDLNSLVGKRYAARTGGIAPTRAELEAERNTLMQDQGLTIDDLMLQDTSGASAAQINMARRRWGGSTRTVTSAWLDRLRDPLAAQAEEQATNVLGQMSFLGTGNEFLRSSLAGQRAVTLQYSNPAESMRLSQNVERAGAYYNQAVSLGIVPDESVKSSLSTYAGLSEKDRLLADQIAQGNRYALSYNWQSLIGRPGQNGKAMTAADAIKFQTIDTETGLGAFETNISATEKQWIRSDAQRMGRGNWLVTPSSPDYDAFEGGYQGMQTRIHDLQLQQRQREYANQVWQRDTNWQVQTGGATGLNAQGFATGGGLAELSKLLSPTLSSMGMSFNAGNGMGMWQLQDWQTQIGRQQQMFNYQQQGQQLQMAWQQFQMQDQRFYEQQGRQATRAEWSESQTVKQMGLGREQAQTQLQWSEEDLAYNRGQSELQYGWQMEDFDYNIRYARGRERRQLMRQRDRAVVSHSMQEGRFDTEEGRLDTRKKWEDEGFKLQEEHFKKSVEWRKEDMALSTRYHEQDKRLEEQRLHMQQEAYQKELGWMQANWQIEDQRRLIERQVAMAQYTQQVELQNKAWETENRVRILNDTMTQMNTSMNNANASINLMATNLGLLNTWLGTVNQKILSVTQSSGQQTGNTTSYNNSVSNTYGQAQFVNWQGYQVRVDMYDPQHSGGMSAGQWYTWKQQNGYEKGGYTGDGAPWEVAGTVHKGEHVVPQGGSLVLRGDNPESLALLKEIRDGIRLLTERGLISMAFNMKGNDVSSGVRYAQDLLDKSYAYVQ